MSSEQQMPPRTPMSARARSAVEKDVVAGSGSASCACRLAGVALHSPALRKAWEVSTHEAGAGAKGCQDLCRKIELETRVLAALLPILRNERLVVVRRRD